MAKIKQRFPIDSVCVVADHLPRQCGIATFTSDLCDALQREQPATAVEVLAMDDQDEGYKYPPRVKFQVRANVQADYLRGADFANVNQYDLAILQHEYGIFGGAYGAHVLRLLRNLRMPCIATLHTVLMSPTDEQAAIMRDIGQICERLIVMSKKAQAMLRDIYDVDPDKVIYIPHGIPDLPFSSPDSYKGQFDLKGRKVLLTFGLLSPGKGIEYMIDALPDIVKEHPDVTYVVLGATHPHIIKEMGDGYRVGLQQKAKKLGVADHVQFHNRFVDLETLCEYLLATDVYVTPYLSEQQIVSGTLSYALGAGVATVSTPYWYAEEMLADGRGRLCDFKNPADMAEKIIGLLDDDDERQRVRKAAYDHTRSFVWKEVARSYYKVGQSVLEHTASHPHPHLAPVREGKTVQSIPDIDLRHLRTLTDDTGIFQHAIFATPDRFHGYCTDDNARALVAACKYYHLRRDESVIPLIQIYLSFLHYAYNDESGWFRNFMGYDRRWLEDQGSPDSHGRAIQGLGAAVRYAPNSSIRNMATKVFHAALGRAADLTYPRSMAFTIVGLHEYMTMFGGDSDVRRLRNELAEKLMGHVAKSPEDWPWFEDIVTYANAKVPQALLLAGQWMPDEAMFAKGIEQLKWLIELQTSPDGHLSIIGNDGWYERDGGRAHFDQQPIEAMVLMEACAEAYRTTQDRYYFDAAKRCLDWFLGDNDLSVPIYNFKTGGGFDGLQPNGPNGNQGAESTLAWLLTLLDMYGLLADTDLPEAGLAQVGPSDAVPEHHEG